MSAALQFPALARAASAQRQVVIDRIHGTQGQAAAAAVQPSPADAAAPPDSPARGFGPQPERQPDQVVQPPPGLPSAAPPPQTHPAPPPNLAFYRKQTEALLRRYLYASMLVGRTPSMLTEPLMRGFASHQPVHTFEDCVIFVLDMESALARLSRAERLLLTRVVLQEYTIGETALLLNHSHRMIYRRLSDALDRLTWILLDNGTLQVPRRPKPTPPPDPED